MRFYCSYFRRGVRGTDLENARFRQHPLFLSICQSRSLEMKKSLEELSEPLMFEMHLINTVVVKCIQHYTHLPCTRTLGVQRKRARVLYGRLFKLPGCRKVTIVVVSADSTRAFIRGSIYTIHEKGAYFHHVLRALTQPSICHRRCTLCK